VDAEISFSPLHHIDNAMIKAIARAFRWDEIRETGTYATIAEITAGREDQSVLREALLRLALLLERRDRSAALDPRPPNLARTSPDYDSGLTNKDRTSASRARSRHSDQRLTRSQNARLRFGQILRRNGCHSRSPQASRATAKVVQNADVPCGVPSPVGPS
jgi:hypothetical protein